jgi:hypothetical protein
MMTLVLAALAVYKTVQVLDALTPKEAMPWVKILVSVILGYAYGAIIGVEDLLISGLAIATLSGTVHSVLRLLTLSGDSAHRKSLR